MEEESQDILEDFHELQKSTAEVNIEIKAATASIAEKLKALDEISDTPDFDRGQINMINSSFDTLQTSEHEELLNDLVKWTRGTKVNFEEFDYNYFNQVESFQQFYTRSLEGQVDGLEQQIGAFDGYLDQMKNKIDFFHNKMGEFFSMLPTDGPYGTMYQQYTPTQGNIGPRSTEQEKIKFYEAQIKCFSDALDKLQELLKGASAEIKKLRQIEAEKQKQLDDLKKDFEDLRQASESKDDFIKELKDDQEKEREQRESNRPKLSMYKSPAIEFSISGDEESKNNNTKNGSKDDEDNESSGSKKKKKVHRSGNNEEEEYDDEESGSHHRRTNRNRISIEDLNLSYVNQNVFSIGESEIAQYTEKKDQNGEKDDSQSIENDEKYKDLLDQLNNLKEENDSLKNAINSSSADDELKKMIDQLTKERDELTNIFNDIQEKNKELQSQLDETEKEKENLNNKLNESEKEKENLNNKIKESEKENEKLNDQIKESEKEKENLKNKFDNLDEQYQNVSQGIQTLKDELEKAQDQLGKTQDQLEKSQEEFNNKSQQESQGKAKGKSKVHQDDEDGTNSRANRRAEAASFSVDDSQTSINMVSFEKPEENSEGAENNNNSNDNNNIDNNNNNNDINNNDNNDIDNNNNNNNANNNANNNVNNNVNNSSDNSVNDDDSNVNNNDNNANNSDNNDNNGYSNKTPLSLDPESLFHYDCSMTYDSQMTQTDLYSSEIFEKTAYEKAERPNYQYQSSQVDLEPYPLGVDNIVFYEVKRKQGSSTKSSHNDYLSNDDNFIAIRSPHSSSFISQSSLNNNDDNDGNNTTRDVADGSSNNNNNNDLDFEEEDDNDIYPPFHVKVQYTPTNKNFKKLWVPKPPSNATPTNSPRLKRNGEKRISSARGILLNSSINNGTHEGRKSQMLAPLLGNPPLAEISAEFKPRYPLLVVQSLNQPPLGGYRIDSDDVSAFRRRNSGHIIVVPRRLSSLRKKPKDKEDRNNNNTEETK